MDTSDGLSGLTQEEFESYALHIRHIALERSTQYFNEPSCITFKSINPTYKPVEHSALKRQSGLRLRDSSKSYLNYLSNQENPAQNPDLNCYLTTGFVRKGLNGITPLKMCLFAENSMQFYKIYDAMPGVARGKFPEMKLLAKSEQQLVENRIAQLDGQRNLDQAKRKGIYILPNRWMLDDVLDG